MLAGSETGGALREPRSSRAKQVQPTSVITSLITWHGVGIHTCRGDYRGEVMPRFGRDLIPLPGGAGRLCCLGLVSRHAWGHLVPESLACFSVHISQCEGTGRVFGRGEHQRAALQDIPDPLQALLPNQRLLIR